MKLLIALTTLILPTMAGAQTVMDGSGAVLPERFVQQLKSRIGDDQADPYGIELDRLALKRAADGDAPMVCGRFNARNEYGGFKGFRPFAFYPVGSELVFDASATDRGC